MGKVLRCDKLRDGAIEVEFATACDAARAMQATSFTFAVREGGERRDVSIPMVVAPHRTKNSTRGIITCFDLRDVCEEEIVEGLSRFGVIAARRLVSKRGGSSNPTDNIVLTFNCSDLPTEVVVGYVRVKVRLFIPNPMRCFRCQRFGHTRTRCDNRQACSKCASTDHSDENCDSDVPRCVNCGEGQTPHASYDRSCPTYAKEKEIASIKATRNVSFREARDIYQQTHPQISYAQKVKATTQLAASASTSLENMNAAQLIQLLKSFGLTVVAAGASGNGPRPPVSSEVATSSTQCEQAVSASPVAPSQGSVEESGWTLIPPRQQVDQNRPTPTQVTATPEQPRPLTAVEEALRRGEEERRAREAKRARLIEKAKGAKCSPAAEPAPASAGSSGSTKVTPETPQTEKPSRKAPPPPPPPPPPQRRRPTPLLPAATPVSRPIQAASTEAPRLPQAPFAPPRPTKRGSSWKESPTEGEQPRARLKYSSGSGRSISADGRPHQEGPTHPRIQFGEGASSDARPV